MALEDFTLLGTNRSLEVGDYDVGDYGERLNDSAASLYRELWAGVMPYQWNPLVVLRHDVFHSDDAFMQTVLNL